MHELAGKKVGIVEFSCKGGRLTGCVKSCGVTAEYAVEPVVLKKPVEAILMDLDGTTLTSEAFWIFIIETTVQKLLGNKKFSLEDADIPFVSGFTTVEHLRYCIAKYAPDMLLETALRIYHETAEKELDKIMKGEGRIDAFKPAEGLKEFLLGVKSCGIKIGLATSGLDYKAIPEIVAAFRTLRMGDPLAFYDSVITGGRRKDVGGYGSLGEIVSKPHPWLYGACVYGAEDHGSFAGSRDRGLRGRGNGFAVCRLSRIRYAGRKYKHKRFGRALPEKGCKPRRYL